MIAIPRDEEHIRQFPVGQLGVQPNPKAYPLATREILARDALDIDVTLLPGQRPIEMVVVIFRGSKWSWFGRLFTVEIWACRQGWQYVRFDPPKLLSKWEKFLNIHVLSRLEKLRIAEQERVAEGRLLWRFKKHETGGE